MSVVWGVTTVSNRVTCAHRPRSCEMPRTNVLSTSLRLPQRCSRQRRRPKTKCARNGNREVTSALLHCSGGFGAQHGVAAAAAMQIWQDEEDDDAELQSALEKARRIALNKTKKKKKKRKKNAGNVRCCCVCGQRELY